MAKNLLNSWPIWGFALWGVLTAYGQESPFERWANAASKGGVDIDDNVRAEMKREAPEPKAGGAPGILVLDDFSDSTLGEFPKGWSPKNKRYQHFYKIAEENGAKYIKADAKLGATSVFRKVKWDLKKYPILEWRWRARVLPKEGNEAKRRKNDSTVGIYVVFPIRFFLPDSLKYVWSTTLPIGKTYKSSSRNKGLVLESGSARVGGWVVERRNIYEDFKKRFGRKKPPNPIGIGLITDADQTKSSSAGDYDYFKILTLEAAKGLPLSPSDTPLTPAGSDRLPDRAKKATTAIVIPEDLKP